MPTTEDKTEDNLPSLSSPRAAPLKEWLFSARLNARCLWQLPATKKNPRAIEAWAVNGHVVIAIISAYGWELYTQPNTNDITATLADAEARVGLVSL